MLGSLLVHITSRVVVAIAVDAAAVGATTGIAAGTATWIAIGTVWVPVIWWIVGGGTVAGLIIYKAIDHKKSVTEYKKNYSDLAK